MKAMVDLRPLTLGEIIDRSATFWRTHWKPLFQLFLGFQLALFALVKAWELVTARWAPVMIGGAAAMDVIKNDPVEGLRQLGVASAAGAVAALVYLVFSNFAGIAGAALIWPSMLGQTTTIEASLKRAVARTGAMFRYLGLMLGWSLLIAVVALVPAAATIGLAFTLTGGAAQVALVVLGSILALVGGLVALLWWVLRFLLASQVLALEDVDARGVFRRCDALSSGNIGPGFMGFVKVRLALLITVVSIILFVIGVVFGLPALAVQAAYGNMLDPMHQTPEAVPQLLMVPAQLLQTVAQAAFAPLYAVVANFFYADMRVRREGLDLQLKLEAPK